MNFGDKRLPPRFWAKVCIAESGCWEWTASVAEWTGYGWYNDGGKARNAHRVMCEAAHGAPGGSATFALHSCDNRVCVNPQHLRWGSAADNSQDAKDRGRVHVPERKKLGDSCPAGHVYEEGSFYLTKGGHMTCRECYRAHWREWNKRRQEPGYVPRKDRK